MFTPKRPSIIYPTPSTHHYQSEWLSNQSLIEFIIFFPSFPPIAPMLFPSDKGLGFLPSNFIVLSFSSPPLSSIHSLMEPFLGIDILNNRFPVFSNSFLVIVTPPLSAVFLKPPPPLPQISLSL